MSWEDSGGQKNFNFIILMMNHSCYSSYDSSLTKLILVTSMNFLSMPAKVWLIKYCWSIYAGVPPEHNGHNNYCIVHACVHVRSADVWEESHAVKHLAIYHACGVVLASCNTPEIIVII